MHICGIIAEYNPFHVGHAYQIRQTRDILGEDTKFICIMSGNFVQRGDLAIAEKFLRAEMAVKNGADLVLELPLPAALSSAAGFARGAVSALAATGIVTDLCFGSESGDLAPILQAAALMNDPASLSAPLQEALASGLSYAAAMQKAVSMLSPEAGAVLAAPNNILGVEYCAALSVLKAPIQPLTIARAGVEHDSTASADGFASASLLRQKIFADESVSSFIPSYPSLARAIENGEAPVSLLAVAPAIVAHLRRLSPQELSLYAGGPDGLENRLYAAIRTEADFAAICAQAQTRRYPLARVRRALLRAWLGLPEALSPDPEYLRVLALGKHGSALLRDMKAACALPIITKPVAEKELPQQDALMRDALADDLYALAYPNPHLRVAGGRFRKTPFIVK